MTIGRVYSVHPSQGEIKFRLTLRVILQLIRQQSDRDCTRSFKICIRLLQVTLRGQQELRTPSTRYDLYRTRIDYIALTFWPYARSTNHYIIFPMPPSLLYIVVIKTICHIS